MNVIPLLVLCSLFLGACGVLMFLYSVRQRDHEHADRLSLLPLEDDLSTDETEAKEIESN
jgi:cbb3-type cytochrome oxidase maturation protein